MSCRIGSTCLVEVGAVPWANGEKEHMGRAEFRAKFGEDEGSESGTTGAGVTWNGRARSCTGHEEHGRGHALVGHSAELGPGGDASAGSKGAKAHIGVLLEYDHVGGAKRRSRLAQEVCAQSSRAEAEEADAPGQCE